MACVWRTVLAVQRCQGLVIWFCWQHSTILMRWLPGLSLDWCCYVFTCMVLVLWCANLHDVKLPS
jgi:hypothetical protein